MGTACLSELDLGTNDQATHILSANHAQLRCERALDSMLTTSRPMTLCRTSYFCRFDTIGTADGATAITNQTIGRSLLLFTQQSMAWLASPQFQS